jgi:hypothetical protein
MTEEGRGSAGGGERDDANDRFVEGIARPLRAPEKLDETFELRVMSAVHAEARAGRAPGRRTRAPIIDWWLRPRAVRFSPLHGLAAAAATVVLTLLAGQLMRSLTGADATLDASAQADTVHVVRFVLIDPAAHSVSLVGDFNAWEKGATRLSAGDNGAWVASIPLRAGRHEYAFIVEGPDGEQWVADPFARTVHDEFDTESSVIMVGNGTSRTAERSSS